MWRDGDSVYLTLKPDLALCLLNPAKTLCNDVSNRVSQNTMELAHLSSPPLCTAVGRVHAQCLLFAWVCIDLSIGMLLLK